MSGFVNKVILVGNLGRDPEVREFPDGAKQAKVSLATSESYKNKNGDQVEHTEWHNLVFRRRLAAERPHRLDRADREFRDVPRRDAAVRIRRPARRYQNRAVPARHQPRILPPL